jgi:D-xylose transport system substrate-binding protein
VSVWKDSRALGQKAAEVASALAAGKAVAGAQKWDGGARKIFMDAVLLQPVPITRANLDLVVKAGWIRKEDLCRNVPAATGPAACK